MKNISITTMFNWYLSLILLACLSFSSCSVSDDDQPDNTEKEEVEEIEESEQGNDYPRLLDNEDRFYTHRIPLQEILIKLSGAKSSADSQLLNTEIKNLSNSGGGIIKITKGTYYLRDVKLRSNVHLKIDSDVTIEPDLSGNVTGKNINIFEIGNEFKVQNAAITNAKIDDMDKSTWYHVRIPIGAYRGVKLVELGNVDNFKISGVEISDTYSVFSAIVLNFPDDGNRNNIPINGIIKDVLQNDSHVGYGVLQMQAGKTILCKNLDGKGGITLRVETGAREVNLVNEKTVDDVVGRDIIIRNGDAAFDLSPHRVDQGRVDVEGLIAINSTYAVRLSAGFLDNKPGTVENQGTFDSRSYVGSITVMGGEGAQIKSKDYQFFDCEERKELILKCQNPDNESTSGRSIGVIRDNSSSASGCTGSNSGCYEVNVENITKTNENFVKSEIYIYKSMGIRGCPNVENPANGNCN